MFNGVDLQGYDIDLKDAPKTANKTECCGLCRQNEGKCLRSASFGNESFPLTIFVLFSE